MLYVVMTERGSIAIVTTPPANDRLFWTVCYGVMTSRHAPRPASQPRPASGRG